MQPYEMNRIRVGTSLRYLMYSSPKNLTSMRSSTVAPLA